MAVERYIKFLEADSEQQMCYAITLLWGRADVWWRKLEQLEEEPRTWGSFKRRLNEEFHLVFTLQMAHDKIVELQQTGLIEAYVDEFQNIQLKISNMTKEEAMDRFVRRLKKEVRVHVLMQEPESLDRAIHTALAYESRRCVGLKIIKTRYGSDTNDLSFKKQIMDRITN
ncbi:hypothetical protein EC973_006485 [Apophysomyces ossiformis]|uniref:Ty3 transposon capsid-like protein domain-containing protein n=1 Tax=Apophysomyces ossiformis TaxID=679940 RepID=A0A8H7BFG1_9FUNG|nr:hypothetical protein EC973_006485 [Apophysomyces ossiformis]